MASMTGFPVQPPPLRPPVLFDQQWSDLTFVHWPVHPGDVAHLFPQGTRPDVFSDGMTYVALVPFVMSMVRLAASPPVPYFGKFLETNIRLYSCDEAGRHGVLFRSLETSRLAIVPATRLGLGFAYTWARMRLMRNGSRITYDSTRRWPQRGLRSRLTVAVGETVDPTPREVWLTARWGAHTRKAGRTWWIPNEHETWPLREARIVDIDDDLLPASGVKPSGGPLRALYSPGVRTRFGRPTVVA
ncbi:MAG: DUF2071 domain-containing protein [Mycobacterium sp.]